MLSWLKHMKLWNGKKRKEFHYGTLISMKNSLYHPISLISKLWFWENGMKSFPIGFFQFMPVIRVLDLKGNRKLVELPLEICRLESLEYLNLAWTSIKKVPIELKNLTKLRCLILNHVRRLEVIPPNVISCLSNL